MSDFCYSWPIFSRVLRQAELMDRMMDRVGASPSVAVRLESGMAWYEARTRCIDCVHDQRCRDWLQSASPSSAEPDFCPNAQFFRECRKVEPKAAGDAGDSDLQTLHTSRDGDGLKVDEPDVPERVQRISRA